MFDPGDLEKSFYVKNFQDSLLEIPDTVENQLIFYLKTKRSVKLSEVRVLFCY